MRYFIVDDDAASRKMLEKIITEGNLGDVIGEAESGVQSLQRITSTNPDVVLIDLLMPELDGIETIEQLRLQGFEGQFIMISQVVNKEMVGEAYEKGIEFFIHKPINRIEVRSILKKVAEQYRLKDSIMAIRQSLAHFESVETTQRKRSVKEIVLPILNAMGIAGEAGSEDVLTMMELLIHRTNNVEQLPSLKELYEAVARQTKEAETEVLKESKAIEQRIRRLILTAINNLAALGVIDYTNPEFEYYAPRYFDFQEIRSRMKQMEENDELPIKVKVNSKKFLQVLYLETMENYNKA
ncbi:response regulator [Sporosarcina sp. ACRSM]|uniref:response regulator n=1 Tax=Sporosarcina sp. ACRSM TaxID=2918216 RepID=UPI001EF4ECC0|nr:response regulator [Sporosarcina sp. ACRSM]MCG7335175.1 response regulator [Sporosarcina sp. ACRSM]